MKPRLWLIFDVSYLAHRASHTTGELEHEGQPTGVTYGVLATVIRCQSLFGSPWSVFTFDHGPSKRRELYPEYKRPVFKIPAVQRLDEQRRKRLQQELAGLREWVLADIGYPNLLSQWGYEADDLIAMVCQQVQAAGDQAIVVSADNDLLQLLRQGVVSQYNPTTKLMVTEAAFHRKWHLVPSQWPDVKAIGGCRSDNIRGVERIGEKTAAQFLAGEMKPGARLRAITCAAAQDVWAFNLQLTRLPFPGVLPVELSHELPTPEGWRRVLSRLGITTLEV